LRATVAVVEAPRAAVVGPQRSRQHDADAMVARRQIEFPLAVALARFQEPAGAVDTQPLDRVARPAAAVGLAGEAPFGGEHALAARRSDITPEVGLVAEQAEPALHLPLNPRRAGGFGVGSRSAPGR